ncbi:MAG: class IV adenylate cyclase [Planctomycetes bacterium]|nr:class IV adenylate cyclase [Planctomycetota bacterium]
MPYEVELKFVLHDHGVVERLRQLGATESASVEQIDRYFNHPSKDFRQTREAFRIRSSGDWNCLTYKGPVIDTATKMRHEIEIPFESGAASLRQMTELMTLLGFRFVREVRKTRTPMTLDRHGQTYHISVDRIEPLGVFLEIELIAEESERNTARDAILKLAEELNLKTPERRSYLTMLMEKDQRA